MHLLFVITLRNLALTSSNNLSKAPAFFDLLYALIREGGNKPAKPRKKRRMTL
jgi:hypothetical protein